MLLNCGIWRKLLRVPWTAWRSNQFILKEISPEYSLEGLMLKLKLQYFGHLMQRADSFPNAGKDWRWEEKGKTEDEMVRWHHRLSGHEFEGTPGAGDGQGGLACCSPWSRKDWLQRLSLWQDWATELNWLNWNLRLRNEQEIIRFFHRNAGICRHYLILQGSVPLQILAHWNANCFVKSK